MKSILIRGIRILPIFFIIVITFVMNVKNSTYNSSELSQEKTSTDDFDRIDYVDSEGNITFAGNKGYATVIKTKKDGHVVLEQYYDEKGELIALPAGYAKILHVYEGDLNTEITYLDAGDEPVVISDGYDTIRRTYTDAGKVDIETYWIGDEQVQRKQGYWQYQRVYDESNRICELRYMDQDGDLVNISSGYALVRRSYTDSATIDMYFDENLQPVALKSGQYGKRKETVDGTAITTYLDAAGEPINTSRGYAVVKSEGTKTLYYDKDGNPVTAGYSQFGIERVNGQNVYLDEAGDRMLRIDNVLGTRPYLVLIFGILATAAAVMVRGRVKIVFVISYIIFIGIMTIAYRESGERRAVFELFSTYKRFLSSSSLRQEILNNIWLFVPLGAALYDPKHRFRWLWAVALSMVIEAVQYFAGIGLCELDDVFSNGLGALIGYVAAAGWGSDPIKKILRGV